MFTPYFLLIALIVLDIAACLWGTNSSDGIDEQAIAAARGTAEKA